MAMAVTDLFLSLPWLFLLITARALMPLNVSPLVSVLVTFLLLGLLGWTAQRRGFCARPRESLRASDFVRQARAAGLPGQTIVLGACSAEFEARALCAVLDFDSGFHL
jgi:peptide/nickel transport system permease protein